MSEESSPATHNEYEPLVVEGRVPYRNSNNRRVEFEARLDALIERMDVGNQRTQPDTSSGVSTRDRTENDSVSSGSSDPEEYEDTGYSSTDISDMENRILEEIDSDPELKAAWEKQEQSRKTLGLGEQAGKPAIKFGLGWLTKSNIPGLIIEAIWPTMIGGQSDVLGRALEDPDSAEFKALRRILERDTTEQGDSQEGIPLTQSPLLQSGVGTPAEGRWFKDHLSAYEAQKDALEKLANIGRFETEHDTELAESAIASLNKKAAAIEKIMTYGQFEPEETRRYMAAARRAASEEARNLSAINELGRPEPETEEELKFAAKKAYQANLRTLKPLRQFGFGVAEIEKMAMSTLLHQGGAG